MQHQNKAGISLPPDLAENFPTPLICAIAHIQVARQWLQVQGQDLDYLPEKQRDNFQRDLIERVMEINELDNLCADMLFELFTYRIEGLPHLPKDIVL